MNTDLDFQVFYEQLLDTIKWHSRLFNTKHTVSDLKFFSSIADVISKNRSVIYLDTDQANNLVDKIAYLRSAYIYAFIEDGRMDVKNSLLMGRLLIFFYDNSAFDGAAALDSKGFFDESNVPPIDLWVYFFASQSYSHILVWIPPEWVHLADEGISVNAERCIQWFDDEASLETYGGILERIPYYYQLKEFLEKYK